MLGVIHGGTTSIHIHNTQHLLIHQSDPPSAYAVPTTLNCVTATPEMSRAIATTTLARNSYIVLPNIKKAS